MSLVVECLVAVGLNEKAAVVEMRRRESEKTARDSHRVLCGKLFEEVDGGAGVALG